MKKVFYLFLIIIMLLSTVSCSDKSDSETKETENDLSTELPADDELGGTEGEDELSYTDESDSETKETENDLSIELPADDELGGVKWENGLLYIDENDPLISIGNLETEVTLSDGTKGTSALSIPYLNVNLEGAKEVSMQIYNDYSEKYASYFKEPDDRIVNINYSYEIAKDTLEILITERIQTPDSTSEITYGYYYDILVDDLLNMMSFASICSSSFGAILESLCETEWAQTYTNETNSQPNENTITAITFNNEGETFDVYCTNIDGNTQTILEITPVKEEIDFSALESTYEF